MPQPTSPNPDSPLNPSNDELPEAIVTELSPRRKPAGKPEVKANKSKPTSVGSGKRVVIPGLGKVNIVIH
jgi:hypothetical protein